jgi:serine/threonine protein kinase
MSDDELILDLLVEWEEKRRLGIILTAEQLCPDRPELHTELQRRILRRPKIESMLDLGDGGSSRDAFAATIQISGYEMLEQVGRGGVGIVHKARDQNLNRLVAIKFLSSGGLATLDSLERFQRESEVLARLQHPNILQVYGAGKSTASGLTSIPYLVLEYAPGGSLADRVRTGPLTPREAVRIVLDITYALQYAHDSGVLHRDLKPGNILIASDGTPKVADFGLAKLLDEEIDLTQTGSVAGSPSYMAPEQASGQTRNASPATDVYALGAILYELLSGRPPFQGSHPDEVLEQVRKMEPLPLRTLLPRLPRDLETIAAHCLEKEAGRRYPTAVALAGDLEAYLNGQPLSIQPVGPIGRGLRWSRRNPAESITMLVIFVSLLVTGLAIWNASWSEQKRLTLALISAKEKAAQMAEEDRLRQKQFAADQFAKARRLVDRGIWTTARQSLLEVRELNHAEVGEIDLELAEVSVQLSNAVDATRYLTLARNVLGMSRK